MKNQQKALDILKRKGPMRASYFGQAMWSREHRQPKRYCLPAIKYLKRLEKYGLVEQFYDSFQDAFLWRLKGSKSK